MIKIGDYIEYEREHYNGGSHRYEKCSYNGCVIKINDGKHVDVIKQYGGQIWCCVHPIKKISEKEFLSDFSIYDEYICCLLKIIYVLPSKMQNLIKNKIEDKKLKLINKMIKYCICNKIKNKNDVIKINDEVWALQWYIYYVLRQHEPYKIQQTLTFCYGATELIKEFFEQNTNFMVQMQFISHKLESIMIYLIQEKWLEFLYEKKLINSKEYSSRLFPIIIKKFELKLELKIPTEDKNITLYVDVDKCIYRIDTTLSNLFDSKFVIANKYGKYYSNKSSKCHKRININLKQNNDWKRVNKTTNKTKRVDKPDFIETNETYLSYELNSQKNIIIETHIFTIGSCSARNFTLYSLKTKKMIGAFEFNISDYEFIYAFLIDIEIH